MLKRIARRIARALSPADVATRAALAPAAALRCTVAYNRFGAYSVPLSSSHRPAARAVLAGRVWEPDTLAEVTRRCRGGDVVHAGTYFGDFLPALARACTPGTLWAFEPNPENFRCARITAELNGLDNVALRHAGLGAAGGALLVATIGPDGEALGGASRLVRPGEALPGSVEVAVVAIDDVVPADRKVDVIQLDVEGSEGAALLGALATIVRCSPVLILESLFGGDRLPDEIASLGYAPTGTVHDNVIFARS
jgi:FkbM family methyltransferase